MSEPFVFIATHRIKEGKRDAYEEYLADLVQFVEDNEPQLLMFTTYFDEDGEHVTGVQVHPEPNSMLTHMRTVREHIGEAYSDYLEETVSIQIFGQPTQEVLTMIERLAGDGVPVNINRPTYGFHRLTSLGHDT